MSAPPPAGDVAGHDAGVPAAAIAPFGGVVALSLLAGCGACLLLPALPPWPWLAAAAVVGAVAWGRAGHRRWGGALLLGFGLAGLHVAWGLARQLPPVLERQDIVVTGRVVDLPQAEPRRVAFRLRVDGDAATPAALRGRLLRLGWYRDRAGGGAPATLQPGSRWRLSLRLRAPRGLRNPGGFDGEKSALAQGIAATGYVRDPASAERLSPPAGIDAWRARMSARIDAAVGSPSSRFVRALALGDTRGIGDDDWEVLRATGLTHLVAISGFHVGLVAGFFALLVAGAWWLLPSLSRRLPRPLAAAAGAVAGGVAYAAVAGFALPTVRTVLMIAVVAVARWARRRPSAVEGLALALVAILLVDPLALLAPGFWLSFAGVGWLLWCLPHRGPTGPAGLARDFVGAQAVATVGLLPLTVVLFGQASLAGPFANLVAGPWWSLVVVPLALLGTGLELLHGGAGGWAWQAAAWCFDASWPLFERLAASPLAVAWLPQPGWQALPLALLGGFWLLLPRGVPGKPLALLLWLPLLWPQRGLPGAGEAELLVVDVGQGLSVLVRTAHHALLYDAGPAVPEGFDAGERAVVPALRALGVRRLDRIVVSHADNDHAGGVAAVRRAFPMASVSAPDGSGLAATTPCLAGQDWTWDGVRFRVLHPTRYFPYLGNQACCVLRVETGHGAVLLPGDIDAVVERRLLARDPAALRADVVVVAHHGSAGSSQAGFVAATGAGLALVSAGYGNRFRHPAAAAVERWRAGGARVASTIDGGALRVRLDADGITLRQQRQASPRSWDAARRAALAAGLSYRPDAKRP